MKYLLEELEQEWEKFINSKEFHLLHGDIDDRKEISQWGFRWFIKYLTIKEKPTKRNAEDKKEI